MNRKAKLIKPNWYARQHSKGEAHSKEATELVEAFIEKLEGIPDGCAETFPFELIDELRQEYRLEIL